MAIASQPAMLATARARSAGAGDWRSARGNEGGTGMVAHQSTAPMVAAATTIPVLHAIAPALVRRSSP